MKVSTRTMVTVGMFAAVVSVLSVLSIPTPSGVPITLQTFAIALCGYALGSGSGLAATIVYILVGTVGVPVFAGMTGGPSWLVGYSGGFMWGFLFLSFFCGLGLKQRSAVFRIIFGMTGLLICHLMGIIQYAIVAGVPIGASFFAVSMPFLLKDAISVAGACFAARPILKITKSQSIEQEAKA